MESVNYKKIAKNALLLYVRTIISIVLQLIAVRFLLKYLGNDDYGLYGLIGSIVVLVESLKGFFSGSIQRFINIEIGKGNKENVRDIFNAGRKIHIYIGIILTVITLLIGIISIPFLNLPEQSHNQAYLVLLFTAINMGVGMIIVPYDAIIVAYEHFNAMAYISIINSVLKLGIVFLLLLFPIYRVSIYTALLLFVTIITRLLNYSFCKSRLGDVVELAPVADKRYYKGLLQFAGFQSLGATSTSLQGTGINFILNIFGGLVVNTARTIAYQVLAAVNVLVWNINLSFSPKCITLWGAGDFKEFYKAMFVQAKLCFIINASIGGLIAAFAVPVLKVWLGQIPDYTVGFVQIIFLYAVLRSFRDALDLPYKASGKVMPIQIIITVFNLISIALAWLFLKAGFPYVMTFGAMVICELIIVITASVTANIILDFPLKDFCSKVLAKSFLCLALLLLLYYFSQSLTSAIEPLYILIPKALAYFTIELIIIAITLFNPKELRNIKQFIISHKR